MIRVSANAGWLLTCQAAQGMREQCAFSGRNSSRFELIWMADFKSRDQDRQNGFLKTAKYKNSRSATALSTVLAACNLPQRASRRCASTDCLSSVGLSNCLLVGRITIRVKGMTET